MRSPASDSVSAHDCMRVIIGYSMPPPWMTPSMDVICGHGYAHSHADICSIASRVNRAPPNDQAAALAVRRKKLLMATVSAAAPESRGTSARVASQAYWSLVPQEKSRTLRAMKCQVACAPPGANADAASAPGVSTRITRPERRASDNRVRVRAE